VWDAVRPKMQSKVAFEKRNTDEDTDLARRYGIRGAGGLVFIDMGNGKVLESGGYYKNAPDFVDTIKSYLGE
jgi:hypothetical protein